MSIEFSPAFDRGTGRRPAKPQSQRQHGLEGRPTPKRKRPASPRRVAANRRNAQCSTGPRTAAGKRRASRNAIKHGLCSTRAVLPGECAATYATFVREIEEELQPRTAMQHALIPHIANLMWRMNRLPQAQADMFDLELRKCAKRETLTASQVIARRFSDHPTDNGFLLLGRYERGLHNQLMRLMSRYDAMQKKRPTTPWPHDEPPVPDEMARPAWTQEKLQKQIDAFARRTRALDEGDSPPLNDYERSIDDCIRLSREQHRSAEKRTQSKPTQNRSGESESGKSAISNASPPTKRTHCNGDESDDCPEVSP